MKNIVSKLLPLIDKFKGKKPIVIILSIVAIAAGVFAVQKGYITEESLDFEAIVEVVSNTFADSVVNDVIIDSVNQEIVVDSVINQ